MPTMTKDSTKSKKGSVEETHTKTKTQSVQKEIVKKDLKAPNETKLQSFIIRTIWTFILIAGFFITLASGHFWCILLVLLCQVATFRECIGVTSASSREKNLPMTKTLNWYFLLTTIYYLDGLSFYKFFQKAFIEYKLFTIITSHHKFICYCAYLCGFVLFVASLRKGHLKFQMGSLCVTHMVLLFVVFQAHLIINNIQNGLFWFLLPCGLVIVNDIFAYLCGITFGKTKLIEISPKKTLEGFIGAWFFTAIASVILTRLLSPYTYLTCPVKDINTNFFNNLTCELNPIFVPQTFRLPPLYILENFGLQSVTFQPVYFHALNLATFASLFAPFGGFFASGLKRTFKVKDFGHSIPGHGGITDRVDCQYIMGSFTNLYFETFISEKRITVETIVSTIIMNLDERQIMELIKILVDTLDSTEMFNTEKMQTVKKLIDSFVN